MPTTTEPTIAEQLASARAELTATQLQLETLRKNPPTRTARVTALSSVQVGGEHRATILLDVPAAQLETVLAACAPLMEDGSTAKPAHVASIVAERERLAR